MGRITPSFRQLYEEKISALEPLFSDLDLSRYRVMAFLIYVLRGNITARCIDLLDQQLWQSYTYIGTYSTSFNHVVLLMVLVEAINVSLITAVSICGVVQDGRCDE